MSTGTVQAANTEAHNVQTAVIAYMADNSLTDATGSVGPTADIGDAAVGTTVHSFLLNPGGLQADYTIVLGEITGAEALTDGKWKDLTYSQGAGWEPTPPPEG